jgi:hypothetical protein
MLDAASRIDFDIPYRDSIGAHETRDRHPALVRQSFVKSLLAYLICAANNQKTSRVTMQFEKSIETGFLGMAEPGRGQRKTN